MAFHSSRLDLVVYGSSQIVCLNILRRVDSSMILNLKFRPVYTKNAGFGRNFKYSVTSLVSAENRILVGDYMEVQTLKNHLW